MKNSDFLAELSNLLNNSEIATEEIFGMNSGAVGTVPRIFGTIEGYLVKFDFVSLQEVKLEVNVRPEHYLFLGHYNRFTSLLKKMKIAKDIKIKNKDFNQSYYLRNITQKNAELYFNKENINIIKSLEPFDYLEQTFKEFRLVKDITVDYTPQKAYDELKAFVQYVINCDKIFATKRELASI